LEKGFIDQEKKEKLMKPWKAGLERFAAFKLCYY